MPPSMSEKIFQEIKNAVKTRSEDLLTFQGVEQDDFDEIIQGLRKPTNCLERRAFRVHWFPGEKYLKVVMPTKIHEIPVRWILNEIQDAIFNGYTKEADLTIIPMLGPNWDQEALFPSVVLETGWAESAEKLAEDVTLWQVGSGGQVRVVFQLKFYKRMQNRIGARLWMNRATPPTNTFASVKTSTKKYYSTIKSRIIHYLRVGVNLRFQRQSASRRNSVYLMRYGLSVRSQPLRLRIPTILRQWIIRDFAVAAEVKLAD
ncbi:hypothetical protein L873DRAFT_1459387 [Choiromyces venosus 120613-1]|uniref:Uncharacterized protein n=1 Tax=Choiromyces venosus 120613-1 TaxID=1336337 RepID=A0A3N4K733_9PEZI|nr:hypothetical protein L873DRAFT_1459387 [Choiromyces venosus 120613-1]